MSIGIFVVHDNVDCVTAAFKSKYNEKLFMDDEDEARLMAMPEVEREQVGIAFISLFLLFMLFLGSNDQ